jgi:hypothetical protein
MYKGVESLAMVRRIRAAARWFVSSAVMLATMRKVQLFAHMTMAYGIEKQNLAPGKLRMSH